MERVMQYLTKWLELSYTLSFRRPSFEYLTSQHKIDKALFDAIAPRFAIGTADIATDSPRTLRDAKTTVSLFGGLAKLEVTADGFQATFSNPIAPGDVEVVKDTIRLATAAIKEILADLSPGSELFTLKTFMELQDKNANAWEFLRSLSSETFPVGNESPFAETAIVPAKQIHFISRQKWSFGFELTRAVRSEKELYMVGTALYEHDSSVQGFDETAKHFEFCVRECLRNVKLEPFQDQSGS
jgi:hypothetical protein